MQESVRKAIDVIASVEDWLPPLLGGLSPEQLRERREGCGGFSLLEHVWHLRDIDDFGYLVRVRRTLEETRPELPDVNGDALAVERAYQKREMEPAWTALFAERRKLVAALRKLDDRQLAREAVLEGAGVLTLGDLLLRWKTHDLEHRVEMERLSAALRA